MGTITHVATDEPVAALTFDDGPHHTYTPLLLKILEKYRVRATFFMVGETAYRQKDLVRQVAQSGHVIGVHTWDHRPFLSINSWERRRQIRACQKAIEPFGQRLFRPPWGEQSLMSRLDALLLGYQVITWNVVAEDWLNIKPEDMAERLIRNIKPGSIVLLHEAIYRSIFAEPQYDRQAMLRAIDIFFARIGDRFRFVTVPELLKCGRPHRENWYIRIPPGVEPHR
jgi:peptidoglycan/xylan/chitin deacetylase (PgdA/CDA1 family)